MGRATIGTDNTGHAASWITFLVDDRVEAGLCFFDLDQQGLIPIGSTPEELRAHFKSEMEKWAPVIKAAGIKVEK